MKPKRWLQDWLRQGWLNSRPLQIPEILGMADEHLRVAAMEGLRRRYLPASLTVAVSGEDYRGLAPFAHELQREMQQVFKRAGEQPRYGVLSPHLEVRLIEAGDLRSGSTPRFYAAFPTGDRQATWDRESPYFVDPVASPLPTINPPLATTAEAGAKAHQKQQDEPGEPGLLFELVLTAASGEHTGLQSLYLLSLDPVLSTRHLDIGDPAGRLILASDGQIHNETNGELWQGPPPRIEELAAAIPAELDGSADIPHAPRDSKLYRFYRPGRPEILWAPQGLLLIGRRADLVHWVPPPAPRNLSGRHFALLQGTGPTLRLVDLGSTNGTYLGKRRLQAFERVQIAPPETFDIGIEGAMQIAVRVSGGSIA